MKGGLKMEDNILKALIIKYLVNQNYLSKEQLSGINNILDDFDVKTLRLMCDDLSINYSDIIR